MTIVAIIALMIWVFILLVLSFDFVKISIIMTGIKPNKQRKNTIWKVGKLTLSFFIRTSIDTIKNTAKDFNNIAK